MRKGPQQSNYEYINGPTVTRLRTKMGLTKKELSERIVCSPSLVSKIESLPYRHVTTEILTSLARVFRVPVIDLIDKEEENDD